MVQPYLQAGEIVATHGVRGECKILPWADSPAFLTQFSRVFLDGQAVAVQRARVQGNCVLMKLAGVDSVEQAAALRGKTVSVAREDAPPLEDGAVYIADLIGLPVFQDGEQLGTIADVLSLPAHDVYVVRGAHEYLIPAVPAFILEVDTARGVTVRLIEGMQSDAD